MKKILITGATGFIGKNLIARYQNMYEFLPYLRESSDGDLQGYIHQADAVIHLAGVSRPQNPKDFYTGNAALTKKIIDTLKEEKVTIPLFYMSSIHAVMDNDFGKSKRAAEDCIISYGKTGALIYIMRLTNTFGKWARPNTHSAIATFCYNISHGIDISISDETKIIDLAHVDDVADAVISLIEQKETDSVKKSGEFYSMTKTYPKTLGYIVETIRKFKNGAPPASADEFEMRLYETYNSYKETA